jgi:hypothetical protein
MQCYQKTVIWHFIFSCLPTTSSVKFDCSQICGRQKAIIILQCQTD